MKELTRELKKKSVIKRERVYSAFLEVDRKDFIPEEKKVHAYEDIPLSIGYGQTISQPSVVVFMIEKLEVKNGENVLDIGCGSGWTTAILAKIVGESGKVTGIERKKELKSFGEKNLSKYDLLKEGRVQILCKDGYKGHEESAPYERILVSAALEDKEDIPASWREQLKEGGVIVVPIKDSIYKLTKEGDELIEEKYFGFRFVPLIKEK